MAHVDMSSRAVTNRLRKACAAPSAVITDASIVDMSPEAVTARLAEACDMGSLCLDLGDAGRPLRASGPRGEQNPIGGGARTDAETQAPAPSRPRAGT